MSFGVYQDWKWKKQKGTKTPLYWDGKWRTIHDSPTEGDNHQALWENECGHHTANRWGEGTCYLGYGPLPPFRNSSILRWGASSPMVLARGSSSATFFPLWREGPSSFIDVMMGYLIGKDWWRGFGKEDMVKRGEWRRHSERMMGKGISLSINDNKDDVKGCNQSVVKRSIVLMK